MSGLYKSQSALAPVEKLLKEAGKAIEQPGRTLRESEIPEILGAVGGIGIGAAAGWGIFTVGASATATGGAVTTSALAAAGSIIGGGMIAGISVVAAPAVLLGVAGYGVLAYRNKRKLRELKELLLQEAIRKNDAILSAMRTQGATNADRADYLSRLVAQLKAVIENLQGDLQPA
jgi:hypothetical protein